MAIYRIWFCVDENIEADSEEEALNSFEDNFCVGEYAQAEKVDDWQIF